MVFRDKNAFFSEIARPLFLNSCTLYNLWKQKLKYGLLFVKLAEESNYGLLIAIRSREIEKKPSESKFCAFSNYF